MRKPKQKEIIRLTHPEHEDIYEIWVELVDEHWTTFMKHRVKKRGRAKRAKIISRARTKSWAIIRYHEAVYELVYAGYMRTA